MGMVCKDLEGREWWLCQGHHEGLTGFSGGRVCEDRIGAQARWCPALLPPHPWWPGQPGLLAVREVTEALW